MWSLRIGQLQINHLNKWIHEKQSPSFKINIFTRTCIYEKHPICKMKRKTAWKKEARKGKRIKKIESGRIGTMGRSKTNRIALLTSTLQFSLWNEISFNDLSTHSSTTNSLWWHSEYLCRNKKRNERAEINLRSQENLESWIGTGEQKTKKKKKQKITMKQYNFLCISKFNI